MSAEQTNLSHLKPTGRLAPSPTGGLHLGHARTFLAAWLSARAAGGRMILRIEDLDASRVRPEATHAAIADLRWLGLDWDEGPDIGGRSAPYFQSERLTYYHEALERLKAEERVYPCTCTRAEIARMASAPHVEDEGPSYPGTCESRSVSDARKFAGHPFAWRFRVPRGSIGWGDLLRGEASGDPGLVGGDFIVAREGVGPSYQLAVVVDDAMMGVTQVIRGADLIPSTPRQLLLYAALGWRAPDFGHLCLVIDHQGRRLAKRDGSIKLSTFREQGADPRRLVGWLGMSLGMSDRVEPSQPLDWVQAFTSAGVPDSAVAVSPEDVTAWCQPRS